MQTSTETKTVTVGDLFRCSWGYDQTNIDYYQVTGVTPSGKSVRLRMVASEVVDTQVSRESVRAVPNAFIGAERTYRIKYWNNEPCVRISSYSHAYLHSWDTSSSQTAWGFGH